MRSDIGPGDFKDSTGRVEIWDLPPFCVTLNFPMVDFENDVGPIRQIPGTHMTREMPPEVADEPEWMKLSTVLPSSAPSPIYSHFTESLNGRFSGSRRAGWCSAISAHGATPIASEL